MKKLVLFVLMLCMLSSVALAAGEFKIGSNSYSTLAEAYLAAKDGDTIVMTKDVTGPGMAFGNTKTSKDQTRYPVNTNLTTGTKITIDFGGHTYSFAGKGVSSSTNETNGFHILKPGPSVSLKNGTVTVAAGSENMLAILIQNYNNLALENMTLIGDGLDFAGTSYTLSNNSGYVEIYGNTSIYANNSGDSHAFDVFKKSNYNAPIVAIKTTGVIKGDVEVHEDLDDDNLMIYEGIFTDDEVIEYYFGSDFHRENGMLVLGIPAKNVSLPKTGDASNLMMWAALMAMATVGFAVSKKLRRE